MATVPPMVASVCASIAPAPRQARLQSCQCGIRGALGVLKLGDAVFARGQAGLESPGELLAHVSPLGWEHINLTGEYRWPGADRRAPRNP